MSYSGIKKLISTLMSGKHAKPVVYFAVIAIGILIFCLPGIIMKAKDVPAAETQIQQGGGDSAELLENKLEAMLSSMRGAGRVRVMLTLDRTSEQVVASNEKHTSGERSTAAESRPATVQSAGREEPIVLTEVFPRIRGVIVLAEGAADIGVQNNIVSAVSTVLGIDERNVEVFVMAAAGGE